MRDYGKVHTSFWSSPTITAMSEDARMLAMYLITSPHSTIAGVFRLPDGYVCEDLRWDAERVSKGFVELFAKGYANRCETTKWVWVRKHLEWNKPENPNQCKSAAKIALSVPDECHWKLDFMRSSADLLGIQWVEPKNPMPTVPEPFLNQEQEQKAGTEAGTGVDAANAAAPTPPAAPIPPAPEPPAPPSAPAADRGCRLPKPWVLPKALGDWALAEFPAWTADTVRAEAAKFADFWHGKTGKDATKLDWPATWRNWCRNARLPAAARPGGPMSDADRIAANAKADEEAMRLLFGPKPAGDFIDV